MVDPVSMSLSLEPLEREEEMASKRLSPRVLHQHVSSCDFIVSTHHPSLSGAGRNALPTFRSSCLLTIVRLLHWNPLVGDSQDKKGTWNFIRGRSYRIRLHLYDRAGNEIFITQNMNFTRSLSSDILTLEPSVEDGSTVMIAKASQSGVTELSHVMHTIKVRVSPSSGCFICCLGVFSSGIFVLSWAIGCFCC